jgi:IrrE N-terminal-like domain
VKQEVLRYPHSASLFRFCRRILDQKYGNIRIIDQDVGQILGFDPADCSHWKKGKKNVRSIQAIKGIATYLGVDERLVRDLAAGEVNDEEAFFECNGYGPTQVDTKQLEAAKKDYYRFYATSWSKDREQEFRTLCSVDRQEIAALVEQIHQKIGFREAPLYLPELLMIYPEISLPEDQKSLGSMRSDFRYRLAIADHFLAPRKNLDASLQEVLQKPLTHIQEVAANLFAFHLLVPTPLLQAEIAKMDVSHDLVTQLAEVFWVSKSFINRRLKEVLTSPSM